MFRWNVVIVVLIVNISISCGRAFQELRNVGRETGFSRPLGRGAVDSLQGVGPPLFTPVAGQRVSSGQGTSFFESGSGSGRSSATLVGRTFGRAGDRSPLFTSAAGQDIRINQGSAFAGISSVQGGTIPLTISPVGQNIGNSQGTAFGRIGGSSGGFGSISSVQGGGISSVRGQGVSSRGFGQGTQVVDAFGGGSGLSGFSGSISSVQSQGISQGGISGGFGQVSSIVDGFSGQENLRLNGGSFPGPGINSKLFTRLRRSTPSRSETRVDHRGDSNVRAEELKRGRRSDLRKYVIRHYRQSDQGGEHIEHPIKGRR